MDEDQWTNSTETVNARSKSHRRMTTVFKFALLPPHTNACSADHQSNFPVGGTPTGKLD